MITYMMRIGIYIYIYPPSVFICGCVFAPKTHHVAMLCCPPYKIYIYITNGSIMSRIREKEIAVAHNVCLSMCIRTSSAIFKFSR